jgi:Virulence-associated protein E
LSANGIYPGIKNQPQSLVASQVEAASAFLSLLTPTKTPRVCSYALKHVAESWNGEYVSNGALIAAAVARGLVVERYSRWSTNPNVAVGVSQKSLKALARAEGNGMTNVHQLPVSAEPWFDELVVAKNGSPKPLLVNAAHALRAAPVWANVLAFDDFAKRTMMLSPPPWEMFPNEWQPRPWTAQDDLMTTEWLQQNKISVSLGVAENAIELVAKERLYHPVLEYLDDIEWDRVPRIDQWMSKYLGTVEDDYTRAVSRCFLISAIARIRQPGCKVDTLPILEGLQGIGKSTVAETLFQPWFSDEIADLGSKDAAMQQPGFGASKLPNWTPCRAVRLARSRHFFAATQSSPQ